MVNNHGDSKSPKDRVVSKWPFYGLYTLFTSHLRPFGRGPTTRFPRGPFKRSPWLQTHHVSVRPGSPIFQSSFLDSRKEWCINPSFYWSSPSCSTCFSGAASWVRQLWFSVGGWMELPESWVENKEIKETTLKNQWLRNQNKVQGGSRHQLG